METEKRGVKFGLRARLSFSFRLPFSHVSSSLTFCTYASPTPCALYLHSLYYHRKTPSRPALALPSLQDLSFMRVFLFSMMVCKWQGITRVPPSGLSLFPDPPQAPIFSDATVPSRGTVGDSRVRGQVPAHQRHLSLTLFTFIGSFAVIEPGRHGQERFKAQI